MLVCDDKFMQAYGAVKTELQQADNLDRKVPIFVSTVDADSVCALRILTVPSPSSPLSRPRSLPCPVDGSRNPLVPPSQRAIEQ